MDDFHDLHHNLTYGIKFKHAQRKTHFYIGKSLYIGTDQDIRPYQEIVDEKGNITTKTRDKALRIYPRPKGGPFTHIRMEFLAYTNFIERTLPHQREWKQIIKPDEINTFDYITYIEKMDDSLLRLLDRKIPDPDDKRSMKKKVLISALRSLILGSTFHDPFTDDYLNNDPGAQIGEFRTNGLLRRLKLQNKDGRYLVGLEFFPSH